MVHSSLIRAGRIWLVAVVLVVMSLSASGYAYANKETGDKGLVPVEYDGFVRYTLDATTMKRYTGLSGNTLVDVWIEGRPDAGARSGIQAILGGYPPGVDYEKVGTIRMRYLFRIDDYDSEHKALAVIIEGQYLDLNGGIIYQKYFDPPGELTEWHSLSSYEEKALLVAMAEPDFQGALRIDPALRSNAVVKDLDEGFLGRSWGIQPEEVNNARHIADLDETLAVYSANLDVSPVLGNVQTYAYPRLIFAKDDGFVQAHISFDVKEYNLVKEHLNRLLGEPSPIIYEKRITKVDFGETTEWVVGHDTKVVLVSKLSEAFVEISKRNYFSPQESSFEEMLAAVRLKQAQQDELQGRILEASSVYQELLNGTVDYQSFTQTAQEHLAAYSRRGEVAEYLGQDQGLTVHRLKNIFSDNTGQQWLRIDLGAAARDELQKQRPADIELSDRMANISAVLCRVRIVPDAGRYAVMEQIWLDSSDRIIGGRPAWAPQDAGWPVPYIKQACETFLEAWLSVGSTAGPRKISER